MNVIVQGFASFVARGKHSGRLVAIASLETIQSLLRATKIGAISSADFILKDLKRKHRAETSIIVHQAAQEANEARILKAKADFAEERERSEIENDNLKARAEAFEKMINAMAKLKEAGGDVYADPKELLAQILPTATLPALRPLVRDGERNAEGKD